jgi:hypothetical protein
LRYVGAGGQTTGKHAPTLPEVEALRAPHFPSALQDTSNDLALEATPSTVWPGLQEYSCFIGNMNLAVLWDMVFSTFGSG